MSDVRGIDPAGRPRDVSVDFSGSIFTSTRAFATGPLLIPGIGSGAAYASGDAFGTAFPLVVPSVGTIATLLFFDYDAEGLVKEFVLFSQPIAGTADNAVFAPTDLELQSCLGVVYVSGYYSYSGNQLGIATPALTYLAPRSVIYVQIVTRGADNIAAAAIPAFNMVIV